MADDTQLKLPVEPQILNRGVLKKNLGINFHQNQVTEFSTAVATDTYLLVRFEPKIIDRDGPF